MIELEFFEVTQEGLRPGDVGQFATIELARFAVLWLLEDTVDDLEAIPGVRTVSSMQHSMFDPCGRRMGIGAATVTWTRDSDPFQADAGRVKFVIRRRHVRIIDNPPEPPEPVFKPTLWERISAESTLVQKI